MNETSLTFTKDLLPPELLDALRVYMDTRLEEALMSHELDEDGYRYNIRRQDREAAWERVLNANNQPVAQR